VGRLRQRLGEWDDGSIAPHHDRSGPCTTVTTAGWRRAPAGSGAMDPVAAGPRRPAELIELRADAQAREKRLLQVIADNMPSLWEKLVPALVGLAGVLVGGRLDRNRIE